jgi:hypothetical protein
MADQILEKIISGGQTGADRAALETAKQLGLATGGTAPRGYKTESGADLSLAGFGLRESSSGSYADRTFQNVHEADATIWFGTTDSLGFKCTMRAVNTWRRLCLINPTGQELRSWLEEHRIRILNVAGNRASHNPTVSEQTRSVLTAAVNAKNAKS